MKAEKINVNKTPQQPNGVEIEIIVPENRMEEGVLGYLLAGFLRDLKRDNRIPYDLPSQLKINHQTQGTFLVSGTEPNTSYYEPPKPLAIVGVRHLAGRFDLIHAPIPPRTPAQPTTSQQVAPATPSTEAATTTTTAPASPDLPKAE